MPEHVAVVKGLELPARLGGHPALDFCNTLAGWDGSRGWDYLASYDHLAVWSGFAGLLSWDRVASLRRRASHGTTRSAAELERAREIRARLYDAMRHGAGAPSFQRLAADVGDYISDVRLANDAGRIGWEIRYEAGLGAPVGAVLWSACQLITSPEVQHVRACPGRGCGWLFLDRRGRRRWCTMAVCGNRAKARAFAKRGRRP
jgi:predicted RNA-binding Zn ribbon-like protein